MQIVDTILAEKLWRNVLIERNPSIVHLLGGGEGLTCREDRGDIPYTDVLGKAILLDLTTDGAEEHANVVAVWKVVRMDGHDIVTISSDKHVVTVVDLSALETDVVVTRLGTEFEGGVRTIGLRIDFHII